MNLGGDRIGQWDTEGLNFAWGPQPGNRILDQTHFLTAQVTLSPDAIGSLQYLASAEHTFGVISGTEGLEGPSGMNFGGGRDARISGGVMSIPEPTSFSMTVFALLGLVGLSRRNYSGCD